MKDVVIIGGGHGAVEAAMALRKKGWKHGICIISEESVAPYQRPKLSKGYIDSSVSEENLLIKKPDIYEKNNITLKLGTRAMKIDRSLQLVETNKNENIPYSSLILATGTRPRTLKIPGSNLCSMNYLRSLNDAKKIKNELKYGTRLLIIGAGYIGLELAASASKLGVKITILEAQERVLARVTSKIVSTFYQDLHQTHGVDIKLNSSIKCIQKKDNGFEALLSDETAVEFDTVVVGIGVEPNIELAQLCGLDCGDGIIVNEYTQTSDPYIYAIGDCCNYPNSFYQKRVRLESVPNALEQARIAASNMCGSSVCYNSVPWFWSEQYNVKLQTVGLSEGYEEIVVRGNLSDGKFCIFYLQDNKIIALDAINSPPDFIQAKAFILNKTPVSKAQLENTSKAWFKSV